jgi:molybdopterin-guanine dinucleotide biosynthesis protein A
MQAKNQTVGVVIAGGRSLRFGGEKAIATFAGKPMLLWAVERLAQACNVVAVNARPATQAAALAQAHALPVLHDLPGDPDGPLAGVHAGLAWAQQLGATMLAVSPCDAPLLPPDLYPRLLAAAGDGAALALTSEGRQPLCAVWPVAALPAVAAAVEGGAHPPTWRLLENLGARQLLVDPPLLFSNINTRDDLARLETLFYQGKNVASNPAG